MVRANPEVFDAEESEVESVMGSSAERFDGWQEFDEEWASIVDLEAVQQTYATIILFNCRTYKVRTKKTWNFQ